MADTASETIRFPFATHAKRFDNSSDRNLYAAMCLGSRQATADMIVSASAKRAKGVVRDA